METLAQDYAGDPVVFIEYNVDASTFSARQNRWWQAYPGSGSVYLPLAMVDSGNQYTDGYVSDYAATYMAMVDTSMARPPQAEIDATVTRVGDTLHIDAHVTNQLGEAIGPANQAKVWVIVYEEFGTPGGPGVGRLTMRYVRATASMGISTALADGQTGTYSLDTAALSGVVWENLHVIVLVDYFPADSLYAYDTLQAVLVEIGQ